ncbi:hypothetical protein NM688_g1654 [Phlebia brevispora]|uniref:Uncharacterized protein n=1 Tax=Phlebia brevispora TaxID=194682 RepID=A0ACC1TAQ9_9APHY|nr:hypothetical protein NM688_g1654 [Phlebia brevispora]
MSQTVRSAHCLSQPAFTAVTHSLARHDRARISYERAKAVVQAHGLSVDDILTLSSKFWDIHRDPLMVFDGAAMTLVTIQVNLVSGTIARHVKNRPELLPLVEDLLRYRKHGQFLLTEVGHGLDIASLETTATLLPDGDFIINTPTPSAAKFMPPTVPAGLPTVGIIWAKLLVHGEDHGARGFIVPLNDGKKMCSGVTSRLLPERGGPTPVNHAITYFNNVRVPFSALLGTLDKPTNARVALSHSIWRVACGTMAFGYLTLSMMKALAAIGTMYSLRRHVGGPETVCL